MNVLENNEIVDINTLNNTKKFSVAHLLSQAKTFITLSPTNTPALKNFQLSVCQSSEIGCICCNLVISPTPGSASCHVISWSCYVPPRCEQIWHISPATKQSTIHRELEEQTNSWPAIQRSSFQRDDVCDNFYADSGSNFSLHTTLSCIFHGEACWNAI